MSTAQAVTVVAVVVLLGLAIFAGMYISTYNGLVDKQTQVTAQYQFMLAAYDRFYVNTKLSAEVANKSINAQTTLTEIYAELRTGHALAGRGAPAIQSQVDSMKKLDTLSFTFMNEAVPKLDVAQLSELNAVIESNLNVINHNRNAFSQSVQSYNAALRGYPANWFNAQFNWGFEQSQGYTPQNIHLPENAVNTPLFK